MRDMCKMCGKRLPSGERQCLNCGHVPNVVADPMYSISERPMPSGTPVSRTFWAVVRVFGIVTIFFTALFAFALHSAHNQPPDAAPPAPVSTPTDPTPDSLFSDGSKVLLVMGSHLTTDPSGSRAVVGRIKNIGPNALSYVRVDITLYGRHGKQVGTTAAKVNGLGAGGVWRFRVDVPQKAATGYELSSVTCY